MQKDQGVSYEEIDVTDVPETDDRPPATTDDDYVEGVDADGAEAGQA